ncbi:MAG: gamma-glutamyl-gamma-aminobutyrate hydrolase family protein [Nocardioides sp.]
MSPRSDRPLIGISTYREQAAWGVWQTLADVLHAQYADAVLAAGGVPVLLPPAGATDEVARTVVSRIDALVISGGADVDPARYRAEPHRRTAGWREDRDAWESALLRAADEIGLPTLGVCRGMQLMAVTAGGSLHQHTPDLVGHEEHSPGGAAFGRTDVRTAEGSRLRGVLGEHVDVGCHHHQSVETHPGFEPVAWAVDGSLEAMERPGPRFCVGVQWHPEVGTDHTLFAALVAAATDR